MPVILGGPKARKVWSRGEFGLSLRGCLLNSVKFLHPVTPGIAVSVVHEAMPNGSIRFDILAGTRKIASGSVLLADAS